MKNSRGRLIFVLFYTKKYFYPFDYLLLQTFQQDFC